MLKKKKSFLHQLIDIIIKYYVIKFSHNFYHLCPFQSLTKITTSFFMYFICQVFDVQAYTCLEVQKVYVCKLCACVEDVYYLLSL